MTGEKPKIALVTGCAGFIGSHLCERLLREGFKVIGIDNLKVGSLSNLAICENLEFEFIQGDIRALDELNLQSGKDYISHIFHLAALADIVPSIADPVEYFSSNVEGTLKVLEFARKSKLEKFVYAASSSCYGIPSVFPTSEDSEIQPQYPYALTKFMGEELVLHWGSVYGLPVISLRLFNVYGPRARTSGTYGAVFGVFLAQKSSGKPLTIVGDGEQTRDFTFVTDVVDAFLAAALSEIEGEVFNVGSGGTYSVNHLASLLGGETVNIPKRPGEPNSTFADISKIRRDLDWNPKVDFESGVQYLISKLGEWNQAPVWTPELIEKETDLWFKYLGKD